MTGLSERSIRIPPGVGGEDNACIYYWDGGDGPGGDDGCPACANFAMKVKPGHCHLLPGKEGRWAILHGDKVSALLTSFPACLIDCLLAGWLAGWLACWLASGVPYTWCILRIKITIKDEPDLQGAPCEARKAICKGKPRFNPWDDKKWADNEIALNIKESLVTPRKRRMDDVSPAE